MADILKTKAQGTTWILLFSFDSSAQNCISSLKLNLCIVWWNILYTQFIQLYLWPYTTDFGLQVFFLLSLAIWYCFCYSFLVGILVKIGLLIATIATFVVNLICHAYLVWMHHVAECCSQNNFQLFRNLGLCQIFFFMNWSAAYNRFRKFNEFIISFVCIFCQNLAFHSVNSVFPQI